MSAKQLGALFERLSDAPDAIPRLRRFILDLAVRGKLLSQLATDEPASELLGRLGAARPRREHTGASMLDRPFSAPPGWAWVSLGDLCSKTGSGSTPRGGKAAYHDSGVPFLRSQNVYNDGLRLDDVAYVDEATHRKMAGTAVRPGDLLLNITGGSIGRCCRVPAKFGEANVSQHVAIIRPAIPGVADFLHRQILSPFFQRFVAGEQTGAGRGGLPKNRMDRIPVALPPLAEQHRIVVKVDELMALCDQLEAARTAREGRRDKLMAASLARLNQPADDIAEFKEHARFYLRHFPRLATRPEHVRQLRQTILNLAVRGRLVPQDSNDEPGSELLRRIQTKRHCSGSGRGAVEGLSSDAGAVAAGLFEIPRSWRWTCTREIASRISDGVHKKPNYVSAGVPFLTVKNLTEGPGISFRETKFITESDHREFTKRTHPERGDVLITKDGTIGVTRVIDTDRAFSIFVSLALVKMLEPQISRFFALCINSEAVRSAITPKGAALKHLHLVDLRALPFPLPPLAEQQRIVAKVDELMAVCDRLEAQLEGAQSESQRLLEAVLHEALGAAACCEALAESIPATA